MKSKYTKKEQIVNHLDKGKLEIKHIEREEEYNGVSIYIEFLYNGKFGTAILCLEGSERGIEEVNYKEEDEDIYQVLLDWYWDSGDLEWNTTIKYKGKEI